MSLEGQYFPKARTSRATVIRINVAFLVFFLAAYFAILLFQPSTLSAFNMYRKVRVSVNNPKASDANFSRLGLVNIEEDELIDLDIEARNAVKVKFEKVSDDIDWNALFPHQIDEEEVREKPSCPEIPMPDFSAYEEMDAVVAKLPCRRPADGWSRDVFRLQVHLVAAKLAAEKGRRDRRGKVKVVAVSKCEPMAELFRCDDLVRRKGEWWMFEVEVERLEEKLRLPVGSCELSLPLWQEGSSGKQEFDVSKLVNPAVGRRRREAYATVVHSSDDYICGAISLAYSIRRSGSTRDLILLHDNSTTADQLAGLAAAGWSLRKISRIRNPRAEKGTYNEYNYSKLRLWQLTDYDKVVFIDADIVVLRNLDHLFGLPQLSAAGNSRVIFNSGVMVIEPSRCTFDGMVARSEEVVSYNGGDQGFLNEMFVWWHRLPRRVNYLKYLEGSTAEERRGVEEMFGAEPARIYGMHSLGVKPWKCYRDYDCNWNVENQRGFASDVAHRRWWRLHDEMEEGLRRLCRLSEGRKKALEWERKEAERMGFSDGHWRLNITDERKNI